MNPKTLTTVFLLLFVAASVAALVIKGSRPNSSAENSTVSNTTAKLNPGAETGGEESREIAREARQVEETPGETAAKEEFTAPQLSQAPTPVPEKVLVYYFFGDVRCPTCMKIESYTAATVQQRFATLIEDGALEWKPTNLDRAGNEHYLEDYQLVTKSVILSRRQGDKEIEWKNLERIWELAGKKDQFEDYIAREVQAFVTGATAEEGS